MAAKYTSRVSAWWTSGRTGLAKCESAPNSIHFSELPEFGGLQGRWTPEQLLLCALAACFTTAFQATARAADFEYTDLEVEIEGNVRMNKKGCDLTAITIRPRLRVQCEDEFEKGLLLLRKAKMVCTISQAVSVPQTLEPRVESVKLLPRSGQGDLEARLTV